MPTEQAQIRPAAAADCAGLAAVQIASYRTAYADFFPPAYFAHMTAAEQTQEWRDWLIDRPEDVLLTAVSPNQTVLGYVLARAQADIHPGYDAEIMALHVRQADQRQGLGRALLRAAAQALHARGCRSAMLWTLRDNPVRAWYERLGGQLVGEKVYEVDGRLITEVAYGWPDIHPLK